MQSAHSAAGTAILLPLSHLDIAIYSAASNTDLPSAKMNTVSYMPRRPFPGIPMNSEASVCPRTNLMDKMPQASVVP